MSALPNPPLFIAGAAGNVGYANERKRSEADESEEVRTVAAVQQEETILYFNFTCCYPISFSLRRCRCFLLPLSLSIAPPILCGPLLFYAAPTAHSLVLSSSFLSASLSSFLTLLAFLVPVPSMIST